MVKSLRRIVTGVVKVVCGTNTYQPLIAILQMRNVDPFVWQEVPIDDASLPR